MTETLKPCPFCGGDGDSLSLTSSAEECEYVQCECGASGPGAWFWDEAVALWNRRASPALDRGPDNSVSVDDIVGIIPQEEVWRPPSEQYRKERRTRPCSVGKAGNGLHYWIGGACSLCGKTREEVTFYV